MMKKAPRVLFVLCLCVSFLSASAAEGGGTLPATLYYNANGGSYYHADPACPSVKAEYLPMTAFGSERLHTPEYDMLKPCPRCVLTAEASAWPQPETYVQPEAAAGPAIDSEAAARVFAEAFFASPYVAEVPNGRTLAVTQTADGWQAALAAADEALPALTVRFTATGRIQQYENSAYTMPALEGFAADALAVDDVRRIDALRNALFPDMPNNECGVFAHDKDASLYVLDHFTFWLGLVMDTDTPRLVAYADLETDAARYPGYLARGEAAEAAKRALAAAYGLSPETMDGLTLIQTNFVMQEGEWTDAEVPLPYWFVAFREETSGGNYTALIDAEGGAVLELHDPATAGNG